MYFRKSAALIVAVIFGLILFAGAAQAHHVLGRPAYSLGEDSNTPPGTEVEVQVGAFAISYMAFPAFPQPGERGRLNVYAAHLKEGHPFAGEMAFKVRKQGWFGDSREHLLGTQRPDDGVHRQGYALDQAGNYMVVVEFEAEHEPYRLEFPLQVGQPSRLPAIAMGTAIFVVLAIAAMLLRRRRRARGQARP